MELLNEVSEQWAGICEKSEFRNRWAKKNRSGMEYLLEFWSKWVFTTGFRNTCVECVEEIGKSIATMRWATAMHSEDVRSNKLSRWEWIRKKPTHDGEGVMYRQCHFSGKLAAAWKLHFLYTLSAFFCKKLSFARFMRTSPIAASRVPWPFANVPTTGRFRRNLTTLDGPLSTICRARKGWHVNRM